MLIDFIIYKLSPVKAVKWIHVKCEQFKIKQIVISVGLT